LPSAPSVATQGATQPPQGSGAACDQNPANAGSGVNESSDRPVSTYTQAASLIGADIMDATRVHGAPRIRTASECLRYFGLPWRAIAQFRHGGFNCVSSYGQAWFLPSHQTVSNVSKTVESTSHPAPLTACARDTIHNSCCSSSSSSIIPVVLTVH
jgi:hypothetical protein